jgi:PAS domain S-box-containing protein
MREILTKKGEPRYIEWDNTVTADGRGRILEIRGFGVDVTALKQAETALRQSEQAHRLLLENSPLGLVISAQKDARTLLTNSAFADLLGISYDELKRVSLEDFVRLIHPQDRTVVASLIQDRLAGKPVPLRYEFRVVRKGSGTRWLEVVAAPVQFQGEPAWQYAFIDITERKLAETSLQESEARQRALLEAMPDLMFQMNRQGVYLSYRAPRSDALYVPASEFIGKRIQDVLPPAVAQVWIEHLERALASQKVQRFEYQLPIRGQARDWEAHLIASGKDEALAVVHEITERKRTEQMMREAQARTEFLIDLMGHDLNNINQGILSILDVMLLKAGISEEWRTLAVDAVEQVKRSAELIRNVRQFSIIEKAPPNLVDTDLHSVFFDAVKAVQQSFPRKAMEVESNMKPREHLVLADEFLVDMFYNLLHNAAKFTQTDQVWIGATVEPAREPGFLRVEIQDRGPGIPDSEKKRIFDRLARQRGGVWSSGIGLTLVKRILERYGGKIWVEDRVAGDYTQGARFVLLLPKKV